MYSGPVAAHAYRLLRNRPFDVAVLVGPSHFVGFDGVAVVASGGFETPFGVAPIDAACAADLRAATAVVREQASAHAREHSLEMQLPFLQRVAPGAMIVPLVMGYQTAETARALGDALAAVLRHRRALLIASTDLSHYHDATAAARLDQVVIDCVSRFDADRLQHALDPRPEHACGGGPTVATRSYSITPTRAMCPATSRLSSATWRPPSARSAAAGPGRIDRCRFFRLRCPAKPLMPDRDCPVEGELMQIEERTVGSIKVLDVKGQITLGEAGTLLKDKINSVVSQGHKQIVINLGGVSYVDSAGLGELVGAYTTVTRAGGRLKLENITKKMHDLLTITKLVNVFETFESEQEAVKSFS